MEYEPIILFDLDRLPKDLNVVDCPNLPPVLSRQLENLNFQVGRVDVKGDGNCGYYVIQLLEYLINNNVSSLSQLQKIRRNAILETGIKNIKLLTTKDHYLEYIEVGTILSYIMPHINVGIVVQTNVKKTGEKMTRNYPIRVINYKPSQKWVFFLLSGNGHHYELLTITENDLHRAVFLQKEAKRFFKACASEFPDKNTSAQEQLVFLDTEDFIYF